MKILETKRGDTRAATFYRKNFRAKPRGRPIRDAGSNSHLLELHLFDEINNFQLSGLIDWFLGCQDDYRCSRKRRLGTIFTARELEKKTIVKYQKITKLFFFFSLAFENNLDPGGFYSRFQKSPAKVGWKILIDGVNFDHPRWRIFLPPCFSRSLFLIDASEK